jgi:hypothetical protein
MSLPFSNRAPNRRANAGADQSADDFQIFLAKVRPLHVTPPRAIHRF